MISSNEIILFSVHEKIFTIWNEWGMNVENIIFR